MKSTWNRTCFPNPPGCCMIVSNTIDQVWPDIKGSRWVVFLLFVSWNWHPHTASGQRLLILFISHSRRDRYRQCLCLGQSKLRQASSGHGVIGLDHYLATPEARECSTFDRPQGFLDKANFTGKKGIPPGQTLRDGNSGIFLSCRDIWHVCIGNIAAYLP